MHPALWISKTGLDAAQTDVAVFQITWQTPVLLALKKIERFSKTCFIKILTSRVVVHQRILSYRRV